MGGAAKRKTSAARASGMLDEARALGITISAEAEAALSRDAGAARRAQWLEENTTAFEARAGWHAANGRPLADIMAGPGKDTWQSRAASRSPDCGGISMVAVESSLLPPAPAVLAISLLRRCCGTRLHIEFAL
ncbi:type II toxin-antitoxin system CcdA family antitoxin [Mangrovicoccus ximenensis]|uniref:type II toxin-antitoxin system CcdA family antitoxin n=1 Tax=Mangrovicoccus ximenensis TaxID=1911570 RepID=UPI000D35B321|nr:type II toxin-antitoxin system CcdA family antitoxin [Mangrovicoccus ximenensis]